MPGTTFIRRHVGLLSVVIVAILIGCGGGGGSAGSGHGGGGSSGGSSSGGTTSGGTTSGGTTSGGTTSGGTTSGGTTSGGTTSGGTTSGGTTSGGTGDPGPWLVFSSDQSGIQSLVKMHLDGTVRSTLSTAGLSTDTPVMNAAGTKIAFVYWDATANIYTCDFDGSNLTDITPDSGANYINPDFNPAGTKIVFCSDRSGSAQIWSMNVNGTGLTQLTNYQGGAYEPKWSPDGTKIAFVTGTTNDDVYVMNANGSGAMQLTSDPNNENQPTWSPDGNTICYVYDFGSDTPNGQIMSMPSSGGGSTRLTNSLQNDGEPCYSLDGTLIFFSEDTANGREIKKVSASGGAIQAVTTDGATAGHPSTGG